MIETHSSSGELLRKFAEITAGKKPARGCSLVRILPRIGRTKVRPYTRQEKRHRKQLSY
jgi:hypothetical protein